MKARLVTVVWSEPVARLDHLAGGFRVEGFVGVADGRAAEAGEERGPAEDQQQGSRAGHGAPLYLMTPRHPAGADQGSPMSKRVAVIGASSDRRKFGNKAVRAFVRQGYEVLPINPHEAEVEGLKAWRSIAEVPGPIDMVTFYVPPDVGITLLEQVAAARPGEVWLNPGSEDDRLVARARALGLEPILACSIIGAGESPSRF